MSKELKKTENQSIKIEGTLREIAEDLASSKNKKKVQLIYAFNGTGKTRLSSEFKDLIATQSNINKHHDSRNEILYYNAFTEDLFYWDNNLNDDTDFTLKIQSNTFINWILKDEGKDQRVIKLFQHYTQSNILPQFDENYNNINFKLSDNGTISSVKISKGEESNFIWSIFYTLIEQVVYQRKEEMQNRSNHDFDNLQYIFIDDPVSSLDENHLIQLAIDLKQLICSAPNEIKFIITTHNTLFYNILYNELKPDGNILRRKENNKFELEQKKGSSNTCFSYHLFLITLLQNAIEQQNIQKYHFSLLRNLYEKTANFLGYQSWGDLLPDDEDGVKKSYYSRIMNFSSHSTLSNEIISEPENSEKQIVSYLLKNLLDRFNFSPTLSSKRDD